MSQLLLTLALYVIVGLLIISCGDAFESTDGDSPQDAPMLDPSDPVAEEWFQGGGGYVVPLRQDPATGIPFASVFQFPIEGSTETDFGFLFGKANDAFPGSLHVAVDSIVSRTPYGTPILAPADGIVRVSTDLSFGYYGSDSAANPKNHGCLILLEHMLTNGQAITTLMGHVQCERDTPYDPSNGEGNPPVGAIVRKGQHIGRVAHYYHGSSQSIDWHHIHFGVRRGRFQVASYATDSLTSYIQGYVPTSEFTWMNGVPAHPSWLDPIDFVTAHGDPVSFPNGNVLQHPSGSLLIEPNGSYWVVIDEGVIARLSSNVAHADRYDLTSAIPISLDEFHCYTQSNPIRTLAPFSIYKRPWSNAIVIAFTDRQERYDFIRWEAFTSWGFEKEDIQEDFWDAMYYEWFYNPEGYRRLRPGTLVKGDAETAVSIVSWNGSRIPFQSGEVFEAAGFDWSRIITVPQSVLDQTAGLLDATMYGQTTITSCPSLPICGEGTICGGQPVVEELPHTQEPTAEQPPILPEPEATNPLPDASIPDQEEPDSSLIDLPRPNVITLSYEGRSFGPIELWAWWKRSDGTTREWGVVETCNDAHSNDTSFTCELPDIAGATLFEFQVNLPDGTFWGDQSCSSGGCGSTLGTVTIRKGDSIVSYILKTNPAGHPYYNGFLSPCPD